MILLCSNRRSQRTSLININRIVNVSVKTLSHINDFERIIEHALLGILEKEDEDVLRFGSTHEVIDVGNMRCVEQGRNGLELSII